MITVLKFIGLMIAAALIIVAAVVSLIAAAAAFAYVACLFAAIACIFIVAQCFGLPLKVTSNGVKIGTVRFFKYHPLRQRFA